MVSADCETTPYLSASPCLSASQGRGHIPFYGAATLKAKSFAPPTGVSRSNCRGLARRRVSGLGFLKEGGRGRQVSKQLYPVMT